MANILLIEDMKGVRSSLAMILTSAGHNVIEAEDGTQGLKAIGSSRIDLVITDIIMPNMDGSEVILKVKEGNASMPILAMSGGGASLDSESALLLAKQKADAVLSKPFSRTDLLENVERLAGVS